MKSSSETVPLVIAKSDDGQIVSLTYQGRVYVPRVEWGMNPQARRLRELSEEENDVLAELADEEIKNTAKEHYRKLRLQLFAERQPETPEVKEFDYEAEPGRAPSW